VSQGRRGDPDRVIPLAGALPSHRVSFSVSHKPGDTWSTLLFKLPLPRHEPGHLVWARAWGTGHPDPIGNRFNFFFFFGTGA
jgi:hypothetical protein